MQWLDKSGLGDHLRTGTFLNLGSPAAVEVAASLDSIGC